MLPFTLALGPSRRPARARRAAAVGLAIGLCAACTAGWELLTGWELPAGWGGAAALAQAPAANPWAAASWIWDDPAAAEGQDKEDIRLRRVLELAAAPKSAKLHITADNRYTLHVNGHKVGADTSWNEVETYDVAKHLRAGRNVLAIEAGNDGGPAGVIAVLSGEGADGKAFAVATDSQWRALAAAAEKGDATWLQAEFDDGRWARAHIVASPGGGPWGAVAGLVPTGAVGGKAPAGGNADVNVTDRAITQYRPASEQAGQFILPDKFQIELVAAEPLIINPVCLALDEQGRMYVSESHTYRFGPKGSPVPKATNPIVRLDPLPSGKGYARVLVAEGFDDPVMGMLVRDGKLWAAANNYLYQFDLPTSDAAAGDATTGAKPAAGQPVAANRRVLVEDKNKAWNPFGMFVLEWGPEGLLYLSVGNHNIDLRGPNGQLSGRGSSGIVLRMQPDGSDMERLTHGFRVPYSFEFDPFGQLWLLSNGEGNPNRFARVIEGVDYHCYSRPAADNAWLAGNHPLAPPCFELPGGACTQLLRYYGANFPESFQGNLFLDNWGRHGFGGANRTIFRYVPDERGQIVAKEPFLSCKDPHFRCSHVLLHPDGGLLIVDWYGRDDESDLTGRIWKVTYTGDDKPRVEHSLDPARHAEVEHAIGALGSPSHVARRLAVEALAQRGDKAVEALRAAAKGHPQGLGAANAVWTLTRVGTPQALAAIEAGGEHAEGRVRRLALNTLRRFAPERAAALAARLRDDADPAARLEAALALPDPIERRGAIAAALASGAAADPHLRYEAAWHWARVADRAAFTRLVQDSDVNVALAGYCALDIALYEGFESKPAALEALAELLASPAEARLDWLLLIVRLNNAAAVAPALVKLGENPETPLAAAARAILTLRALDREKSGQLSAAATRRFLEAVRSGQASIASATEAQLLLELLEGEPPSSFALEHAIRFAAHNDAATREAARRLLRKHGVQAASAADALWPRLLDAKSKLAVAEKADLAATLLAIESELHASNWERVLADGEVALARDVIRSWRGRQGDAEASAWLLAAAPRAIARDASLKPELAAVLTALGVPPEKLKPLDPPAPPGDVAARREATLAATTNADNVWLGRRVFERADCVKCHASLNTATPRAPVLAGIGKAQPPEYLLESILEPSKVIKTGFETELLVTEDGETLSGVVREEGAALRVVMADRELTLPKAKVADRKRQNISLMPAGQADNLSPGELVDLLAYLRSLK